MRELLILSGKGGTGKTTLTASFAALAGTSMLVDCDVDAADLDLLLQPSNTVKHEFRSGYRAVIDPALCTGCGLCREYCRFGAITDQFQVEALSCEGCGLCARICPVKAVRMDLQLDGYWMESDTCYGPLIHARLGLGGENSGRLVQLVRSEAHKKAERLKLDLIITDGPPGIGCPVISSISGVSHVLLVTEPSPSGFHDLNRVAELCRHFAAPASVCINKYDLNPALTAEVAEYCRQNGLTLSGYIPFDRNVNAAISAGKPLVEHNDGPAARAVRRVWEMMIPVTRKEL